VISANVLSIPPAAATPIERSTGAKGLIVALSILLLWAMSLTLLLASDVDRLPLPAILLGILVQMFLYTGLFITAHDAMHGVVYAKNIKINNLIGAIALQLYALFSFEKLLKTHWQHHHHPASDRDPDFHDGQHKNFFAWYGTFMRNYWSWWRLVGLVVIYHALHGLLHIPQTNLTLFWVIPSIVSSVQLFYFGTYRPHREPAGGYDNPYRATTTALPAFWSFITCYHFGYHHEHHEFPNVPWWQLPAVHHSNQAQ
jgi:beta-carotene ketolase (CrtW type)